MALTPKIVEADKKREATRDRRAFTTLRNRGLRDVYGLPMRSDKTYALNGIGFFCNEGRSDILPELLHTRVTLLEMRAPKLKGKNGHFYRLPGSSCLAGRNAMPIDSAWPLDNSSHSHQTL